MSDQPANTEAPDCVVVGAGPAGLLLALLLGRRGRDVVVLERQSSLDGPGSGICPILQPATLSVLDAVGVLGRIRTGTTAVTRGDVVIGDTAVAGYTYDQLPDAPLHYALPTPITTLRLALADQVRAMPNVRLLLGSTVERLTDDGTGRRGLIVATEHGRTEFRPGVVVGCDGKRSAVRTLADVPADITTFGRGYVELRMPMPPDWGGTMRAYFGADGYLLATPIAGDQLLLVWIAAPDTVADVLAGPLDRLVERCAGAVGALAPWLREQVTGWHQVREFPHHIVRVDRWVDGNVLLVGDSAHGMHAYGGQGLNMALQDAACLADRCHATLADGDTTPLREFEALRRPYVGAFQDMQQEHLAALAAPPARRAGQPHLPDFGNLALGQPELRPLLTDVLAAAAASA